MIPNHSIYSPLYDSYIHRLLLTLLLGFNCGSSFGITEEKWLVATRTAVSTMNASATGGIFGLIYSQWATKCRFVRPYDIVNGTLGGLISSSPTSACIQPYEAMIIGGTFIIICSSFTYLYSTHMPYSCLKMLFAAIGGLVACWSNEMMFKKRFHLDDPVGALGAHAVAAVSRKLYL